MASSTEAERIDRYAGTSLPPGEHGCLSARGIEPRVRGDRTPGSVLYEDVARDVVSSSDPARVRWQDLFRGYDIRGRYPQDIDPPAARRIGRAIARGLPGPFVIGWDTRNESHRFARELVRGLLSEGARLQGIGMVPTPEVAYLARHWRSFGLAVTPSHNALGYVGLKGFSASGRLFDREWRDVRRAFERSSTVPPPPPRSTAAVELGARPRSDRARSATDEYLDHITQGLESRFNVILDTRGGATATTAPAALGRLGNRVVPLTRGFSPRFFGGSPEPRPETLAVLSERVRDQGGDVGFAFDGDGDRCVVVDERGRWVEPEVIALLLVRTMAGGRTPLIASVDASQRLEEHVRTVRCPVGGRYVNRAMRRVGAEVGVEPSGHYYLRRYGEDSDGVLVACCVCDALAKRGSRLSELSGAFGPLHRTTFTQDFGTMAEARRTFRSILQSRAGKYRRELDGVTIALSHGSFHFRPSHTQPSLRFTCEARNAASLARLVRAAREITESFDEPRRRPTQRRYRGGGP